ncbi:MAG: type III pantothenate kinase, partial [Candidatus Omnitrophota bacterium]|nr:type III pantothenate kinase [Candidatus Omnitrophota bacterium]
MLLTIDIGNTNISFGIFKGKRVIKRFDIPTSQYSRKRLSTALGKTRISDTVICSVVPAQTLSLKKDLRRLLGRRPYIIGKQIRVPIRNLYRKPAQVGQDRLVNAFAAVVLYAAPCIIVDLGTAVTFDAISGHKEYMGGMILPGIGISLDVLYERTALLPRVKLGRPREVIGRDTKNSITSGMIYGFSALADNLTTRIKKKIGSRAK